MTIDTSLDTVITVDDVETIAGEVWASLMLDMAEPIADAQDTPNVVTASVSVTGNWSGHVTVTCSQNTAVALTAMMLGIDAPEVVESDMADAVGELANMVGGSLKGLLPPPSTLSLPHVITGAGAAIHHFPHSEPICDSVLPAVHGPVTIAVWFSKGGPGEDSPR